MNVDYYLFSTSIVINGAALSYLMQCLCGISKIIHHFHLFVVYSGILCDTTFFPPNFRSFTAGPGVVRPSCCRAWGSFFRVPRIISCSFVPHSFQLISASILGWGLGPQAQAGGDQETLCPLPAAWVPNTWTAWDKAIGLLISRAQSFQPVEESLWHRRATLAHFVVIIFAAQGTATGPRACGSCITRLLQRAPSVRGSGDSQGPACRLYGPQALAQAPDAHPRILLQSPHDTEMLPPGHPGGSVVTLGANRSSTVF